MAEWPHLSRAPITEALIDIRVELPTGSTVDRLAPFADAVRAEYPKKRERKEWHSQLVFPADAAMTVKSGSHEVVGHMFYSADGLQVVQARLDGFTFSRLKPYEDWEHLVGEAKRLWKVYRDVAKPVSITRIAVRFINRLELPLPLGKFTDWIVNPPGIPPGLPQSVAGFMTQLHVPFTEFPKGYAIITHSVKPAPPPTDHVPYTFDIDAFEKARYSLDDESIWARFEELREIKNRVFFRTITQETLGLLI